MPRTLWRAVRLFAPLLLIGSFLSVASALVITATASAGATVSAWAPVQSYPAPFNPTDIACPSASVCEAAGGPGIMGTTNGGTTWTVQALPSGFKDFSGLVCPSTTMCEVSATNESNDVVILGTTDGGTTWTEQTSTSTVFGGFDIVCPSTTMCEAAGLGQLLGTTNGGATWTAQTTPSGMYVQEDVACASTTVCEAAGYTGSLSPGSDGAAIIGTTNGGATWTLQTVPTKIGAYTGDLECPSSSVCYAAAYGYSGVYTGFPQAGTILNTTDGGTTWNTQTLPSGALVLSNFACPSSTTCEAVGAIGDGGPADLFGTANGGTTWTDQGSFASYNWNISETMACSSPSICVVAGTNYSATNGPSMATIMGTTDGGTTWTTQTVPASITGISDLVCGSATACAATATNSSAHGAILGTTNDGSTWTTQTTFSGLTGFTNIVCASTSVCEADGSDGDNLVMVGTSNGGTSWTTQTLPSGTNELYGQAYTLSCPSPTSCEALGESSSGAAVAIGTTNGGSTWTDQPLPAGANEVSGITCPTTSMCEAVVTNSDAEGAWEFLNTTNGGSTWTWQTPPSGLDPFSVVCASATVCEAEGTDGIGPNVPPAVMGTTDGGSMWVEQTLPSGIAGLTNLACPSTTVCELPAVNTSNAEVVLGTTNGGSTWNPQTLPSGASYPRNGTTVCVTILVCETVAATDNGQGPVAAFGTTNGGTTWNAQTLPGGTNISNLVCPSVSVCEGVGYDSVLGTTNGGSTWAVQPVSAGSTASDSGDALNCPSPSECFTSGLGSWPTGAEILGLTQIVPTTTVSPSNPGSVVFGQSVSYSASVSGNAGPPTGTVTFSVGGTTLCSQTLNSGSASCSASNAPLGSDTVTLSYGGDGTYGSNSTTSSIDVAQADTTTALSPSANPTSVGVPTTYTATVAAAPPGSGSPSGTVDFTDNGTAIDGTSGSCAAVPIASGKATCTTTYGSIGSTGPIAAAYSGDTDFMGSTSSNQTENISAASSTTTAGVNPSATTDGGSVTYSASVSGGAGTPTGSVTFTIGSTTLCSNALTSGATSCSATNAPVGDGESVTAAYSGSATYSSSHGSATLSVAPGYPTAPGGSTGSQSASSGPSGTATATEGNVTGTGSGYGSLTVATYGVNPTSTTVSDGTGTYYDVKVASGSAFTSLTITVCNPGLANTLDWYNGSAWVAFSNQSTSGDCLVATVTSSTVPSLAQLVGTPIALVDVPPPPPPPPPPPSTNPSSTSHGYWLVGSDGGIFSFGSAQFYGSMGGISLQRPVVGIVPTRDRGGYWLDASDGGVFSFGDTQFYGSIPGLGLNPAGSGKPNSLNAPIVGMVPSHDQGGYFMVASDGGVFAFGDAHFAGSCPGIGGCSGAAVAVMPDASGNGYWLVTSNGSVYTFGDAPNLGAPGPQSSPITSAVATPDGGGYDVLDAAGQVFSYGDAPGLGSLAPGATGGFNPASAIFVTSDNGGYWVSDALGDVYTFGDAPNDGSMAGTHLNGPVIAASGS